MVFLKLFVVKEIGKELKDGKGVLGAGISFADSEDRGFPLVISHC
jgi:hypothetical protein